MSHQKNKPETPLYNERDGIIFMANWPAAVRWLSVIPVVIIVFIMVRFLFFGTVLHLLSQHSVLLSNYIGAFATGLVYFSVVTVGAAAAPYKRRLTAMILALLLSLSLLYLLMANWGAVTEVGDIHGWVLSVLATVCSICGAVFGVIGTHDGLKKVSTGR
ncbi:hypothetical protein [Budvicia aquatica]|uniref:Uncharacterized protein n=1 Tax=Budvicia aquatica TaxID=82979 RepID=A0A2C6DFW5_9GAMM|nr:hypothetical protein [Budvicia aquatica]PHI29178.1 hypothetical protein CRN84_07510 [Budvicia aquatica]VFS47368.1 Uncharacterised protein [Budvicia aquatica]